VPGGSDYDWGYKYKVQETWFVRTCGTSQFVKSSEIEMPRVSESGPGHLFLVLVSYFRILSLVREFNHLQHTLIGVPI